MSFQRLVGFLKELSHFFLVCFFILTSFSRGTNSLSLTVLSPSSGFLCNLELSFSAFHWKGNCHPREINPRWSWPVLSAQTLPFVSWAHLVDQLESPPLPQDAKHLADCALEREQRIQFWGQSANSGSRPRLSKQPTALRDRHVYLLVRCDVTLQFSSPFLPSPACQALSCPEKKQEQTSSKRTGTIGGAPRSMHIPHLAFLDLTVTSRNQAVSGAAARGKDQEERKEKKKEETRRRERRRRGRKEKEKEAVTQ